MCLMRIIITNHAQISLADRKIARYEVEDTIRYYDKLTSQSWGPMKAEKRFGNRTITVIFEDRGKEKIFITAWANDVV